jgi:type IV secretion system protein VirB2
VRGLLSSTLLRTLAVIAVIVTGLLWFTGRASTAVLVTVIIGIAIVFSADAIVGAIAG